MKNKKLLIVIVCIILVIAISIGGYFIYQNINNKDDKKDDNKTKTSETSNKVEDEILNNNIDEELNNDNSTEIPETSNELNTPSVNENYDDSVRLAVEKFVNSMTTSVDDLFDSMDLKGAEAWQLCSGDETKFIEQYNKVTDDEVNEFKNIASESFKTLIDMFKSQGNIKLTVDKMNSVNESNTVKGLYTADVSIKMELDGESETESLKIIIYNGKVISLDM